MTKFYYILIDKIGPKMIFSTQDWWCWRLTSYCYLIPIY